MKKKPEKKKRKVVRREVYEGWIDPLTKDLCYWEEILACGPAFLGTFVTDKRNRLSNRRVRVIVEVVE